MSNAITLLTKKQKIFYERIKTYIGKKGEAPTVAELVKMTKASSPRAVAQYLIALERKGLIERSRYQRRGIVLKDGKDAFGAVTVTLPVIASAGCDNLGVLAQRAFDDFICVSSELLQGKRKEQIVSIKAVGDSMDEAGISEGDYVLVELTDAVEENDLVVAIVDSFAVIKKIEYANNAIILRPVSSDPKYKPIILRKDFRIFGRVVDVIRMPAKGDLEIVPLLST